MISIIIPLYNAEKYIQNCIISVRKQKYTDWEMIIIDDNSTDTSWKRVSEYLCDPRVKIYHNEVNLGVGASRNKGLKEAKGDFIVFVDADDELAPEALSSMNRTVCSSNVDYAIFGNQVIEGEKIKKQTPVFCGFHNKDSFLKRVEEFQMGVFLGIEVVWGGILKNEIIRKNNLFFRERINVYEDRYFVLDFIKKCKSIFVGNDDVYHYFIREENTTNLGKKIFTDRFSDVFHQDKDYFDYLKLMISTEKDNENMLKGCNHGFINRVIGDIYKYVESHTEQDNFVDAFQILLEDQEFIHALDQYQIRNSNEDETIPNYLRNGHIKETISYVKSRVLYR